MKRPRLTVISETKTGVNKQFHDNSTNQNLSRNQLVKKIEKGEYDDYHVRVINGIKYPVSNPDPSKTNNLG